MIVSEMDALIAYLQVLGTMVDFSSTQEIDPSTLDKMPAKTKAE